MAQIVMSIHYELRNRGGEILDSSKAGEPFPFFLGSRQIIPGLEKQLSQMKPGDKKHVEVSSSEGYGARNEELVVKVPTDKLPGNPVKVGDHFRGGEGEDVRIFRVLDIANGEATLDGNHPLAGQDLFFDVEVVELRDATEEEIQHGHAHPKGGHHHH